MGTAVMYYLLRKTLRINFRHLAKDTSVKEHVKRTSQPSGDIPFIDLTICPSYHSAYKDDVLKYYGIEKTKYRSKGAYRPNNDTTENDLREIFKAITYNVDEILSRMEIVTLSLNTPYHVIDFSRHNFTEHLHITTKFWSTYGRCYSLHPTDDVLKLGVTGIIFEARVDMYVYFGYRRRL